MNVLLIGTNNFIKKLIQYYLLQTQEKVDFMTYLKKQMWKKKMMMMKIQLIHPVLNIKGLFLKRKDK